MTSVALDQLYDRINADHAALTGSCLLSLLDEYCDGGALVDDLVVILHDAERLQHVANTSYRTAGNFDNLVLLRLKDRFSIKIHIWWASDERPEQEPHNHRWDFASGLLFGSMRVTHYDLRMGPVTANAVEGAVVGMLHRNCGLGNKHGYSYLPIGPASAVPNFSVKMKSGIRYALHNELVHSVSVDRKLTTATLVFQGPAVRSEPVALLPSSDERLESEVTRFDVKETRASLERVVELLS